MFSQWSLSFRFPEMDKYADKTNAEGNAYVLEKEYKAI
jgi:hypothetical protein